MWPAPRCRSGGLACGCEFDSSSGVKLADERNKQSGATAAPVERIRRSCRRSRPLHEPRAEPGPDWFSRDIFSRDIYGTEGKDLVMSRFRDAVLAVALATGGVGCATFCDECDDFPVPGGPGGYALMPGSYAGGPLSAAPDTGPAGSPSPASPSRPAAGAPAGEAAPTPPAPPPASPGRDTGANAPGANGVASATPAPTTTVTTSDSAPPVLPSVSPDGGLRVPAANLPSLP